MAIFKTEDIVRDEAGKILGSNNSVLNQIKSLMDGIYLVILMM